MWFQNRDESRPFTTSAEGLLRHISQPFVVEVRGRRGRSAFTKPLLAEKEASAVATRAGARDADKTGARVADQAQAWPFGIATAPPTGRILPSLIQNDPEAIAVAEAEPARRDAPQTGAAQKKPTKRKQGVAAHVPSADLAADQETSPDQPSQTPSTAPLATAAKETGASTKKRRTGALPTGGETPRPRPGRGETDSASLTVEAPIRAEPSSLPGAPQATPATVDEDASRDERRRSRMARYVFGTELKLGERWKERLRRRLR
jgi:hypothetical protein